jgi:hypothetical protein
MTAAKLPIGHFAVSTIEQPPRMMIAAYNMGDRIDPLANEKPASVLDRKHELSRW